MGYKRGHSLVPSFSFLSDVSIVRRSGWVRRAARVVQAFLFYSVFDSRVTFPISILE